MNILTLPLRVVTRRGVRSILAVAGVALAIAGFVAIVGLTSGVAASVEAGLGESGGDIIISASDSFNLRDSNIAQSLETGIRQVAGVADVAPMLFNLITVDDAANMIVTGWPPGNSAWREMKLASGRAPTAGEDFVVVLGEGAADALRKRVGDKIEIMFRSFTVVGVARFDTVFNQNGAFVPLPVLQDLLGRAGRVTLFEVRLSKSRDLPSLDAIKEALKRAADGLSVHESADVARNIHFLQLLRSLSRTVAIVVLSLSALGIANTLLMSVLERTREFGILSAIGWRPSHIVFLVSAEGMVLSLTGGVLGILGGYLAMVAAARLPFAMGFLQAYMTWPIVAISLGASLGIGVLGAAYPAWRAARLWPADAMRGAYK